MGAKRQNKYVRFWKKVYINGDCWEWQGARYKEGYGSFWIAGVFEGAHRIAYRWTHGEIPEGTEVDHLCSNPPCVRPSHLEAVTHAENIKRGMDKADRTKWKNYNKPKVTHCKYGHRYTPGNTYHHPNGSKVCRSCKKIRYLMGKDLHKYFPDMA